MVIPEHILAQDVWLFVIVMLILVGLSLWSLSRTERKEDERRRNRHVRRIDSKVR
jgi:CHASE3 domain sensor protein